MKPDDRTIMGEHADLDTFIVGYPSLGSSLRARLECCRHYWESVPETRRVHMLLEVLGRYRKCRQEASLPNPDQLRESFALNELTSSCYALRPNLTENESLAILRTAFHTC